MTRRLAPLHPTMESVHVAGNDRHLFAGATEVLPTTSKAEPRACPPRSAGPQPRPSWPPHDALELSAWLLLDIVPESQSSSARPSQPAPRSPLTRRSRGCGSGACGSGQEVARGGHGCHPSTSEVPTKDAVSGASLDSLAFFRFGSACLSIIKAIRARGISWEASCSSAIPFATRLCRSTSPEPNGLICFQTP